jgi:hypothetical protein
MALSYDDNINLARALTLCSDAVRFAPVLSSVFTRALATRSGILFKLNFYEEALKDWDLVESETTHDPTAKYKVRFYFNNRFYVPFHIVQCPVKLYYQITHYEHNADVTL